MNKGGVHTWAAEPIYVEVGGCSDVGLDGNNIIRDVMIKPKSCLSEIQ
jgi:hypothetical protein